MTRRLLLILAAMALLASVPSITEAQGAACTGMCWHYPSGDVYCGFTALQEGGRCHVDIDSQGRRYCALLSCSGGSGWFPENQGSIPWLVQPSEEKILADTLRVTVKVVEPRT